MAAGGARAATGRSEIRLIGDRDAIVEQVLVVLCADHFDVLALRAPVAPHSQLRAILAELDLLMAIDGFRTIADLRAAGAQRI